MLQSKIRNPFSRLTRDVTALGSRGVANAKMLRVTSHAASQLKTSQSEADVSECVASKDSDRCYRCDRCNRYDRQSRQWSG